MSVGTSTTATDLPNFVERWAKSGGSELANYQLFVIELCDLFGLPHPHPAEERNDRNDYVFERRVDFKHPDGSTTPGRIDLYKRDCFILEAKQSSKRKERRRDPRQAELLPEDALQHKAGTAKRGTAGWDAVMVEARRQAENYARALPVEHGYPPFLLIVDVAHVIEVFADFSGQGKNYAHFPDRRSYRIALTDLDDEEVRERLRTIWTDPQSLDPTRKSAEVTRDIAERLALIARRLEAKGRAPAEVAEFLMRCLFTMYAEDTGLLPDKCFEDLLAELEGTPERFQPAVEHLWKVMDEGGYEPRLMKTLRRFNGTLFKKRAALALDAEDIHELRVAAHRDWRDVEPAIFGTLLEQALEKTERARLGAHYTPRTYVERLVVPTIIEPLREDWEEVQARIEDLRAQGKDRDALRTARAFHRKLCTTRVLDPACGTGNFLYVSLELMKRLEGEVLEAISDLGGAPDRLSDFVDELRGKYPAERLRRTEGRFTVDPHQFYGLELNPRAVAIADLVLWIGYLKWQLRTGGPESITEPVLDAYGTIRQQDAILAYDRQELLRDEGGKPITRWDGRTTKLHPITGEEIPDPDAKVELSKYVTPRPAPWPEVEFIVGNPPFIAGKDMRVELGDGYAEAAWKARPKIPGGADFVMHFWDEAATRLHRKGTKAEANPLRRFGFITTNSATQTFSRRVIERYLRDKMPLSLVFAVPNHPWVKAPGKAAVRIAMTVAEKGEHAGTLAEVVAEHGLDTDTPSVALNSRDGKIAANLTLGADLSATKPLMANELVSSPGVKLHGAGFIVTPQEAKGLGLGKIEGLDAHILPYRNGRDLAQRPRGVMVIDLYPLEIDEVRDRFPDIYQHVAERVKPDREQNREEFRRRYWWWFGRRHTDFRNFIQGIRRMIVTVETTRHRFFQFLETSIRPDNMLVAIGSDRGEHLATLSSRVHALWSIAAGGWLGVGNDPRYSKSRTFDPFPFPAFDAMPAARKATLRDLGERLDAFRKDRISAHGFLTITGMYNVLERVRELDNGCPVDPMDDSERDIHEAGLVTVLRDIHDDIDRAVLSVYGWDDLIPALVGRPGATLPSQHKSPEQEAAEQQLLSRLVALNQERWEEERRGHVRWLRPDYQPAKLGIRVSKTESAEQIEAELMAAATDQPRWPTDGLEQIRIVRDLLAASTSPALPEAIGSAFAGRNTQKRKERVEQVLETLVATGTVRRWNEGSQDARYFVPR